MPAARSGPARVGPLLRAAFDRLAAGHDFRAYRIWDIWDAEVGPMIARRARPAAVRNGVLTVTVATHTWMQELQFVRDTLRERLNARLGEMLVRQIVFVTGPVPDPPDAAADTAPAPPPPAPQTEPLPPLHDPALAAAFARLVHAHRRNARDRQPPARRRPP